MFRTEGAPEAELQKFEAFPDEATPETLVEARWHALTMVVTPTCHISDEEKDEDIVAVVPVEPAALVVPSRDARDQLRKGRGPIHLFPMPATELGDRAVPWEAVAQLDRPTSLLKHELRRYRRLGLYIDSRFELRGKLAWFWARASAKDELSRKREALRENNVPLEEIE